VIHQTQPKLLSKTWRCDLYQRPSSEEAGTQFSPFLTRREDAVSRKRSYAWLSWLLPSSRFIACYPSFRVYMASLIDEDIEIFDTMYSFSNNNINISRGTKGKFHEKNNQKCCSNLYNARKSILAGGSL